MKTGRRRVLVSACSALALAACSRGRRARATEPVIVIGAGAAGLAAADALRRCGRAVVVLEARDRIGGRIHAVDGLELGAELVHGAEASSWPLLRAGGIATEPLDVALEGRDGALSRLQAIDEHDVARLVESLANAGDRGAAEVLAASGIGTEHPIAQLLSLDLDLARQSASALAETLEDPARTSGDHAVRGGYVRMLEPLARGLDLRRGHVVRGVIVETGRVRVELEDGAVVRGSAAIVTLPLGVLRARRVRFEPALPEVVERAIDRLGVVDAVKLFYRFDGPIWPEGTEVAFTQGPGPGVFWSSTPARHGTEHVVCGWATHATARALLEAGEAAALEQGFASLRAGAGSRLPPPRSTRWSEWSSDPFALGAYSFTPAGGHGARRALIAPVHGRVWLAGEATGADGSERGAFTVHGALESGWRAAAEVDAMLG
jgi:monoamine oxidase